MLCLAIALRRCGSRLPRPARERSCSFFGSSLLTWRVPRKLSCCLFPARSTSGYWGNRSSLGARAGDGQVYYFVGIDKARFKRPVTPGDQMRLELDLLKTKRGIWVFEGRALVDGELCASAELMCTVKDIDQ